MPLFVLEGRSKKSEIKSMPGIFRLSPDLIVKECKELWDLGIPAVALFPVVEKSLKDKTASASYDDTALLQRTIRAVKNEIPPITVITDVAMDPYSSDGHDGLVGSKGEIQNDETLPILCGCGVVWCGVV